MKTIVQTNNYRVDRDEETGHTTFLELQRDHKGAIYPVSIKTIEGLGQALNEIATALHKATEELGAIQEKHKEALDGRDMYINAIKLEVAELRAKLPSSMFKLR